jgi:rare lipoprotein A
MKNILFIILLFSMGIAHSQVANEKTKAVVVKDTSKNKKILFLEPVVKNDSVPALFGKLTLYKKDVLASYYHDKFNGKRTASGEKFSNNLYTAAHRKFPFGTMLKITNEANGKYVVVAVNDRGPFTKGREIDLSRKAYKTIAVSNMSGYMKVKIEVIEP